MSSRDLLQSFDGINRLIDSKIDENVYLQNLKTKVDILKTPHLLQEINNKIDNLEKIINNEIDILINRRNTITELLNKIPSEKFKAILIDKYINCYTLDDLAEKHNFSRRHIERIIENNILYLDSLL